MTQLSPNFTLEELLSSQTALRRGIKNVPTPDEVLNLHRLATTLLEPIRALLGVPLHVDSGYRSPVLNAMIGGAKDSAHLDGRAADLVPIGMGLREAFDKIRASALPLDQIIIECGAWIHVAIAPDGQPPRLMALVGSGRPGNWTYVNA